MLIIFLMISFGTWSRNTWIFQALSPLIRSFKGWSSWRFSGDNAMFFIGPMLGTQSSSQHWIATLKPIDQHIFSFKIGHTCEIPRQIIEQLPFAMLARMCLFILYLVLSTLTHKSCSLLIRLKPNFRKKEEFWPSSRRSPSPQFERG